MSTIDPAPFLALCDFFLFHKESLLDDPFRGKYATIWACFVDFCRRGRHPDFSGTSLASFGESLADFNDISGGALELAGDANGEGKKDKIELINLGRIEILLKRLLRECVAVGNENESIGDKNGPIEDENGPIGKANPSVGKKNGLSGKDNGLNGVENDPIGKENTPISGRDDRISQSLETSDNPFQDLLKNLNAPLRTKPKNDNYKSSYDYDYSRLWNTIAEPTAMVKLGRERAKLVTAKRPFFEVCDHKRHVDVMTTTFFNMKTLGQSNEIPSAARVNKLFLAAQGLIDKEVHQCIRTKVHYLPLITNYTEINLGNCSYLDTCHKLRNCRYVHYFTMYPSMISAKPTEKPLLVLDYTIGECHDSISRRIVPAQWINCDVRHLPFNILGKFAAIISDPAWDIHMALPYGTCKDTELLSLPMQELQDEGIICLWVTGRSIEIGRKALALWGYTVSDEVIWIKTNQLNRTIVTGRTGHWLNHSKEHLLIGVKGNPIWLNRKVDLDFIVSGTRETLRKPDELYEIVERIVGKHSRKLEIFGRDNNIRPGWVSMYLQPPSIEFIGLY